MMMTVIGGGGLPPVHKRHQHSRRDFVPKRASLFQNFRHTKSPKKIQNSSQFFKKKVVWSGPFFYSPNFLFSFFISGCARIVEGGGKV
jgi:hypothetical protein